MVSEKASDVRREFNSFASKVSRLELLRRELDLLDIEGFEPEVRLIRAKLNDIHALPEIERSIRALRKKIAQKTGKASHEPQLTTLKRNIQELRTLIHKKHAVSLKRQLSSDEVQFVRDIPALEKQLRALHAEFESHMHTHKTKIDSGVGLLVDTKFDDFVSELKAELTKRLADKELSLDVHVQDELREQRTLYANKYRDLVSALKEKYAKQIQTHLHAEVQKRFNAELEQRLAHERKKVVAQVLKEQLHKLKAERQHVLASLEHDFARKRAALHLRLKSELAHVRNSKAHERALLNAKLAELAHESNKVAGRERTAQRLISRNAHLLRERLAAAKNNYASRLAAIRSHEKKRVALVSAHEKQMARRIVRIRLLEHRKHEAHMQEVLKAERGRLALLEQRKHKLDARATALKSLERQHSEALQKERGRLQDEFSQERVVIQRDRESLTRQRVRLSEQKRTLLSQIQLIKRHEAEAVEQAKKSMHEQLVRHKRQNDLALKQEAEKMKDHLRAEAQREAVRVERIHEAHIAERLKKRDTTLRAQFEKECSLKYEKLLAQKQAELNRKKLLLEREVMGNLRKVLS